MNSGPTSERAYDALKLRILAGAFQPGQRLEPTDIGRMLEMSITPVRDALHVLAGEALVDARTSDGFHLPLATEGALRDLYAWNAQVLVAAISTWPKTGRDDETQPVLLPPPADSSDPRSLFEGITMRSGNREHLRTIRSNSERLNAARRAEPAVLGDTHLELVALAEVANSHDRGALRLLINAYHRRRFPLLTPLVDAINQDKGGHRRF